MPHKEPLSNECVEIGLLQESDCNIDLVLLRVLRNLIVITSYSIHYTKLYEAGAVPADLGYRKRSFTTANGSRTMGEREVGQRDRVVGVTWADGFLPGSQRA